MSVDFSCIIPTFRRPVELLEAIHSVLSQEGVSVEVIAVDDSPEKSARAAIEKFGDPRVRYWAVDEPSRAAPGRVRNQGWLQWRTE